MLERFGTAIDFDIEDALQNLKRLQATVPDGRALTLRTELETLKALAERPPARVRMPRPATRARGCQACPVRLHR